MHSWSLNTRLSLRNTGLKSVQLFLPYYFAFAIAGSIDPWHALSVLTNQSASEPAIFIPGTSHCANMGSDQPGDPLALRQAREVC